jgi:hypothetical protein
MKMEIAFSVEAADLHRALSLVSIVKPQSTSQNGAGGYLFSVRGETCAVYARDNQKHEARSSFKISNVSGEGQFMFPADSVKAVLGIDKTMTFKATENNGVFKVRYTFGGAGSSEKVSFDPREMHNFEKDIQTAQDTIPSKKFSSNVLSFAFGVTKSFLPKKDDAIDQEFYKTVKIFGDTDPELAKRANGYMIASNNKEICYLKCDAFLNKDLTIPMLHLGLVESFLGRSDGQVDIYTLDNKSYLLNGQGDVLGWPKQVSEYTKFQYYSKTDEVVVLVSAESITRQLRFLRNELPNDKSKIRMHFDPSDSSISFSSVDEKAAQTTENVTSEPVDVKVTSPFVTNVNVDHMLHMFEGIRGDRVEFRVKIFPATESRPKDRYMFRTIDGFLLSNEGQVVGGIGAKTEGEAHECTVTRYAPGMD